MNPTITQLQQKLGLLQQLYTLLTSSKSFKFYKFCLNYLGVDASPRDLAKDMVGCAETVTTLLDNFMGCQIILGTATLESVLATSRQFVPVVNPEPGCIIISPTGSGNGTIEGHTGIVGMNGQILSNDSYTGKFSANWSIKTWTEYYHVKGGLPIYYYKLI